MSKSSASAGLFCLQKEGYMNNVYDCVESFSELLNLEYKIVLGRKGKMVSLLVRFDKNDAIDLLPHLQEIFDSNDTVFRYNNQVNVYSLIKADYLMKNRIHNHTAFIFLSQSKDGTFFCRSLFPETNFDYTKNQAVWTLLYKEKINRISSEKTILYKKKL